MNPVPLTWHCCPGLCSLLAFLAALLHRNEVQNFFLYVIPILKPSEVLGIVFTLSLVFRAPHSKAAPSFPSSSNPPVWSATHSSTSSRRPSSCFCTQTALLRSPVFLTVCVVGSLEALLQSCSLWKLSFTTSLERESSSFEHLWTYLLLVWQNIMYWKWLVIPILALLSI